MTTSTQARGPVVIVRPLRGDDVATSSRLHQEVLQAEFLARCGARFLRCYQRAWIDSHDGIALAAEDDKGRLVGALLGAVCPDRHYRAMVRHHGLGLGLCLLARAMTSSRFARELVTTRAVRYGRGLLGMLRASSGWRRARGHARRQAIAGRPTAVDGPVQRKVGEVTHLMVRPDARGSGVGRALLAEACRAAQRAGLDDLVLVTPPDPGTRGFYEHLGWVQCGDLTSRSGEHFVRYCRSFHL